MKRERVEDILQGRVAVGSEVEVAGWVRTLRESRSGLAFLHMSDGSIVPPLQVLCGAGLSNFEAEVRRLTPGCAVVVRGKLIASQGKGQTVEVDATDVQVVGWVDDPETYPIQPKRHSFEYLREVAHLRVRTNLIGAVARVRHSLSQAIHRYFDQNHFYWIHTPIITGSDAEGAGAMFRVSTLDLANPPRTSAGKVDYDQDFFGRETHLTVSGQLNVECYCLALSRVYTFGPTFRAENSNTRRHLAEFWMVEPEMAFFDLFDNMDLAERFLKRVFRDVLEKCPEDMEFFRQRVEPTVIDTLRHVIESKFIRLPYTEAISILETSGREFEFPVAWGNDLQAEHERYLTEQHFKSPVILHDYPRTIKPFYMRLNDDGRTVRAMDVLVPKVGEIIGGSQREERLDVLEMRMKEQGLDAENYWWYLDLRRFGSVPHSGFGLGVERVILFITGMANIRDVIPFPRTPGSAEF